MPGHDVKTHSHITVMLLSGIILFISYIMFCFNKIETVFILVLILHLPVRCLYTGHVNVGRSRDPQALVSLFFMNIIQIFLSFVIGGRCFRMYLYQNIRVRHLLLHDDDPHFANMATRVGMYEEFPTTVPPSPMPQG